VIEHPKYPGWSGGGGSGREERELSRNTAAGRKQGGAGTGRAEGGEVHAALAAPRSLAVNVEGGGKGSVATATLVWTARLTYDRETESATGRETESRRGIAGVPAAVSSVVTLGLQPHPNGPTTHPVKPPTPSFDESSGHTEVVEASEGKMSMRPGGGGSGEEEEGEPSQVWNGAGAQPLPARLRVKWTIVQATEGRT